MHFWSLSVNILKSLPADVAPCVLMALYAGTMKSWILTGGQESEN